MNRLSRYSLINHSTCNGVFFYSHIIISESWPITVTQVVYAIGTAPKLMLGRGFTGNEHLDTFRLINMNARLYDPVLRRFLSPDPYVQATDFTQGFNRYSYCMNSPLCYVDENGEFWLCSGINLHKFNFTGNRYTGGKLNFVKSLATKLDYASKGLGVISIGMSWNEYRKENYSLPQTLMDSGFGVFSMYGGVYGSWSSIWYSLGKEYGPIHKYLEYRDKHKK